ncbi:MAG: hypothetical protein KHX55_04050 [Proteobacteria bacterium]|nr:hypothetical protein [Pseudomonadota bacterium]
MVQSIDYDEITQTRVPGAYCEIDNSLANRGLSGKPSAGLLIGQKLAGLLEYNKISGLINNADQVIPLAGEGSELHRMAKAWFKNNKQSKLFIIAVEQTEGTAAVYHLAVTAAQVKAGMVNLMIGGSHVRLTINEGDTAAEITTALIAKINANAMLPVTAATVAEKDAEIDLTAKHKGDNGNFIDIRLNYYDGETTADGVSVAVSQKTNGAGNASLADTIAAIGDFYAPTIVSSYTDAANIRLLKEEIKRRFGAMVNNESSVYMVFKGTLSEMLNKVEGVNHQCFSVMMDYKSPNMPEERASAYAAVSAIEFQKDPARQIAGLELVGDLPAQEELSAEERNMLLEAGVATVKVNADGCTIIEREATTYRKNSVGATDTSYFDMTTTQTVIYLRYSWKERIQQKFQRCKLAGDDYEVQPGQKIVTPKVLTGEIIALAEDWLAAGLIEDISGFKNTILTMLDANDTERLNQLLQPNPINNLRIAAGKLQFVC